MSKARIALIAIGTCLTPVTDLAAQTATAASDQAATTQADTDETNGEIVVTAQKREQNIQDVPLAVQVVNAAALEASGVRDFTGLNRVAPSLVVRPAENPVNASVSVRGIGTFAFSIGVEPSVAVQVDDVPIAFQARAFADLSDISRIEVLRGPQSTLYGKSASAGLINIVTPNPSSKPMIRLGGLATTDDQYAVNAVFSAPLTDTFGFRSTLNYDDFAGNIRNLTTGDKINGQWIFSTRNKFVWDPTPDLKITAGLDYIKGRTTVGRTFVELSPDARLRGVPAYTPAVVAPGIKIGRKNDEVANDYLGGTRYSDFAQSLKIAYDTGGPTVMSITSHDKYKLSDTLDWDGSALTGPSVRSIQVGDFGSRQWTQEFRLVSPGADRFRYTLGLFYADVSYTRDFLRGPGFGLSSYYATAGNVNKAAFGQLEFDVLPQTTLIGGLRVGREKVDYSFNDRRANTNFAGDSSQKYTTYKVGVQQKLGEDIMLFATRSTGFKGESYDLTTGFNQTRADGGPVRPEKSLSHEIGARTQFFERRLTLNATLFNTNYRNFQAQGVETLPDGSVNFRLANVGKLRTRGAELELSGRVGEHLRLSSGVTYLDAKIIEFPGAQCYAGQTIAQGCTGTPGRQDLAGGRPAQAPKWKLSAGFDYAQPIGDSTLEGVFQGAYSYQSKINFSLSQDPRTIQPGYGILNLTAGVRDRDKGFSVMLFVNNLLDQQYLSNMNNQYANFFNNDFPVGSPQRSGNPATLGYLPRDFHRYGGIRVSKEF